MRVEELMEGITGKKAQGYKAFANCKGCGEKNQRLDDTPAKTTGPDTEYFCRKCSKPLVAVKAAGGGQYKLINHGDLFLAVPGSKDS